VALSRFVLTSTVTIQWPSGPWSEVVNGPVGGAVVTPSVPASTVIAENPYPFPVQVVITGGTMTAVTVNGLTVGTGAGTYLVPAAGTISMTYSVAPTWAWSADAAASATPQSVLVASSAPPGGQAGVIPTTTFLAGTVIYADSSAGSSAPQLLYQAIGAGNLRAYVDGQDIVGHAALAN
jgi:hypothetical protein